MREAEAGQQSEVGAREAKGDQLRTEAAEGVGVNALYEKRGLMLRNEFCTIFFGRFG